MKILFSCLLATVGCFATAQMQNADLSHATYSGYDRNLSFGVDLGYRGSFLVSGTNTALKPNAAVSPEPGVYNGPHPWTRWEIIEFKVYVKDLVYDGAPGTQGWARIVRFASTRFEDDEEIPVRLQVTFELECATQHYTEHKTVEVKTTLKAYNKATCFGVYPWEHGDNPNHKGVQIAATSLSSMNHSVSSRSDEYWTKLDCLREIGYCTVFYVNADGGNFPLFETQDGESVDWSDVWGARFTAWSNGLPPINLAFVDACETAINIDKQENHLFSQGFLYPIGTGTQGSIGLNRAQVGWLMAADVDWTKPFNEAFWGALASGRTVSQARDAGMIACLGDDVNARAYVAVFGDYYTRLKTVYTGDNTPPMSWFKVDGLIETGLG